MRNMDSKSEVILAFVGVLVLLVLALMGLVISKGDEIRILKLEVERVRSANEVTASLLMDCRKGLDFCTTAKQNAQKQWTECIGLKTPRGYKR